MTKPWLHRFLSRFFLSGCSDYNPLEVRRACRSKSQARTAFAQNNLPYAQGSTFVNPISALKFAKKHAFPLVVKPNVGGFSRGAYFPINNNTALLKASIGVKKWWPVSIIEQYLLGKNYRVVMTKLGVMSILRRYPPFVIGNSTSDISQLIDDENLIRKQMDLLPIAHPIPKNSAIKRHLKQQKMCLSSVPVAGQKVYLHHKIALKLGSSVEIIDKKVLTRQNKQDLEKILTFFDANILGIDVICEQGIEVDFNAQACIFLELNSRPFLKMHDKPRYGEQEDLSDFYQQLNKIKVTDNEKY
ncbi:cyanophycin synthetase [Bathymodiolus thermophilus thioautotrophic gill symbiont]|uniref:Cyanophycin synthase ) n=1 Tax=Bathymodiolus thermophilus thioautotrophic gill symbiont TaxID=2360 RepID=A0A8H9CF36_9GAMM|nr:cyanophycin synthetase [Bathymodiolus thermophilus thioautotrophic gill symbiont]CAB5496290.1 Cyanophycin synthase (EC (EC [Bathymodiolus thermophilus thioautotrophic gill symbiont]